MYQRPSEGGEKRGATWEGWRRRRERAGKAHAHGPGSFGTPVLAEPFSPGSRCSRWAARNLSPTVTYRLSAAHPNPSSPLPRSLRLLCAASVCDARTSTEGVWRRGAVRWGRTRTLPSKWSRGIDFEQFTKAEYGVHSQGGALLFCRLKPSIICSQARWK